MSILALKTKNIMEHKTLQFFQRPLQPGCLFSFLFFLMAFFLSQEAVAQESRKTVWQQIKEAEDGDVIDLKGETYEWNYIEFSGKKTVTLKNGTIIRPDGYSVNKVELLFGVGGGFKLILDEVTLKGGRVLERGTDSLRQIRRYLGDERRSHYGGKGR